MMHHVIVLTREATQINGGPGELARLRAEYAARTCVVIPGLLDPPLLDEIRALVAAATFEVHRHSAIALDERARPGPLAALLSLVLNDPVLLVWVAELAACGPVGGFEGRVYRMRPGSGHYDSWHSDCGRERRVAISINLNVREEPTAPLQIRRRDSDTILHEVTNATPGDAVLFAVDGDHVHRIASMPDAGMRVACAGWFYEGAGLRDRLKGKD